MVGRASSASGEYLVQLSEVSQKEEVGRLGSFELTGVPCPLLAPGQLGVDLLILSHDHTIVCLHQLYHREQWEPVYCVGSGRKRNLQGIMQDT